MFFVFLQCYIIIMNVGWMQYFRYNSDTIAFLFVLTEMLSYYAIKYIGTALYLSVSMSIFLSIQLYYSIMRKS